MSRNFRQLIPFELHSIKAQQIYKERIAEGRSGNAETDWQQAENELVNRWWSIKIWQLKTMFADPNNRTFILDIFKTIATFTVLIGIYQTSQNSFLERKITESKLTTDRIAKAVEQIGSNNQATVIGGIYSLEKIAQNSPEDHWQIMEILTAFVRENSPIPSEIMQITDREERLKALNQLEKVSVSVQTALTVIGRRDVEQDYTSEEDAYTDIKRLDLTQANLAGAKLIDGNYKNVDLIYSNLHKALISGGDFGGAFFMSTNLSEAVIMGSHLTDAMFNGAYLNDSTIMESNFFEAESLEEANLRDLQLSNVGDYNKSKLKTACFWDTVLFKNSRQVWTGEEAIFVEKGDSKQMIKEIRQNKASDPKNLPDCNRPILD